jgi:hypothetical protein
LPGLSEATSDQLFLSLRVAAIERFCRDNEPMPFIADDLFVSSDEAQFDLSVDFGRGCRRSRPIWRRRQPVACPAATLADDAPAAA